MIDVRSELIGHGLYVGPALYEKCLYGSGIYPLDTTRVVKAELTGKVGDRARLLKECTYMKDMYGHAVGPKIYASGSFNTHGGQTIVYTLMERYVSDLDALSTRNPSLLMDPTVGWMINRLFRRAAYRARMLLTDLKPSNIVTNMDLNVGRLRINEVVLIDFGSEHCIQLPDGVHARIGYVSMLLLYTTISTAQGLYYCAKLMKPFIRRQPENVLRETVTWMEDQPLILQALRQYTTIRSASDMFHLIGS
jgi:serine/threonine protein kinase